MAHKTLVGGTAYNVTGGKSMVSGTTYSIKKGRTLVGGTGYDINFSQEATALLYNTGDFAFQRSSSSETGKTVMATYTGFEDNSYSNYPNVPWNSRRANIKNVYCNEEIEPTSIAYWFYNCRNLTNFNYVNFNINKIVNMRNAYRLCYNLTGSPVCGEKVTSMYSTYDSCYNLTGSPVCGEKVTNMSNTYTSCSSLTGSPVCGENVTNMRGAYDGCSKLNGSPVCGDKVVNFAFAYNKCINILYSIYFVAFL